MLEGKSFLGSLDSNQEGIDGVMFNMGSLIPDAQSVSLKETGGSLGSVLGAVQRGSDQAEKAQFTNVALYINAPNVGNVEMLRFIQGGKQNLIHLAESGRTLSSITVFTRDGVVRSAEGKTSVLHGPEKDP